MDHILFVNYNSFNTTIATVSNNGGAVSYVCTIQEGGIFCIPNSNTFDKIFPRDRDDDYCSYTNSRNTIPAVSEFVNHNNNNCINRNSVAHTHWPEIILNSCRSNLPRWTRENFIPVESISSIWLLVNELPPLCQWCVWVCVGVYKKQQRTRVCNLYLTVYPDCIGNGHTVDDCFFLETSFYVLHIRWSNTNIQLYTHIHTHTHRHTGFG